MIIRDRNGEQLSLTKNRLSEIKGSHRSKFPFYVLLKDLRESYVADKETELLIHGKDSMGRAWRPGYPTQLDPYTFTIGCRTFSPETFAQILIAAGIKTAKARKKSKRK